jgi:hypothetical protein
MSLHVLRPQPDSSRSARLAVGKLLRICANFWVDEISVASRATIKALDRILRHILGIREFSQEPGCVLRYSEERARTRVTLPNGEAVQPGDLILELHFWNDRLGRNRNQRSSPISLRSALRRSLTLLAEQLQSNESFANIRAVHATLARLPSRSCRTHHPFGCTLRTEPRSDKWRLHDSFENVLIHSLRWTFNPRHVKQESLHLNRIELWISVSELQARFCGLACPAIPGAPPFKEPSPSSKFPSRDSDAIEAAGD